MEAIPQSFFSIHFRLYTLTPLIREVKTLRNSADRNSSALPPLLTPGRPSILPAWRVRHLRDTNESEGIMIEPSAALHPTGAHGATAVQDASPLDVAFQHVEEVSTLPQVALQVIQVARNPESGAADLCAIVESDPALSSRVLKCVNSAAYGLRNRVTNLQHAISMLGFKQVRNLAITASVSKVFKDNKPLRTYTRPHLWRHMVCVAITSRMIAKRCNVAAFEECFLAGLLHDIGIILEDQYCHQGFRQVMFALTPDCSIVDVEQQILGFDHTTFGARFARASRFPEEVEAAIRYHHDFSAYRGPHASTIACVQMANFLCTLKDYSSIGMVLVQPDRNAMAQLKVSRQDMKVWAVDLDAEIEQNSVLFKL